MGDLAIVGNGNHLGEPVHNWLCQIHQCGFEGIPKYIDAKVMPHPWQFFLASPHGTPSAHGTNSPQQPVEPPSPHEEFQYWTSVLGCCLPSGELTQLWKISIFNAKTHYKWPLSIAILVYQRVLFGGFGFWGWFTCPAFLGYPTTPTTNYPPLVLNLFVEGITPHVPMASNNETWCPTQRFIPLLEQLTELWIPNYGMSWKTTHTINTQMHPCAGSIWYLVVDPSLFTHGMDSWGYTHHGRTKKHHCAQLVLRDLMDMAHDIDRLWGTHIYIYIYVYYIHTNKT